MPEITKSFDELIIKKLQEDSEFLKVFYQEHKKLIHDAMRLHGCLKSIMKSVDYVDKNYNELNRLLEQTKGCE